MPTPSEKTIDAPVGCPACRKGAYSAMWPPPERIAVNGEGPEFLHQCGICETYWHFDMRSAYPIFEEKARQLYPAAFADWSPRDPKVKWPQVLSGDTFTTPLALTIPDWPPENALELALAEIQTGIRDAASVPSLLAASTLAVPSTRLPQPNGADMIPLAFRRGAAALVLIFTTPERARRYAGSAPFCLMFSGQDFLARLPVDFGLVINDGYAGACWIGAQNISV